MILQLKKLLSLGVFRRYLAILHDGAMAALSFLIALYLRLGSSQFSQSEPYIAPALITFTAICTAIFIAFKLYRNVWQYSSSRDLINITKAVTLSILLFLPAMFWINRLEGLPRSVVVINWFVLLALLGGPRFFYRAWKEKNIKFLLHGGSAGNRIPAILVGINQYSEFFLRENAAGKDGSYNIIAIVDEDPNKIGNLVHNIKVHGSLRSLPRLVAKLQAKGLGPQKIIIAPDILSGLAVRYVLKVADRYGLSAARLPQISQVSNNLGKIEIQPIAVEDLLGRAQTALNKETMTRLIKDNVILVTGAGGSIGSELVRQICRKNPLKIVLFDSSEHNLYTIDKEVSEKFANLKRRAVLGDVRDKSYLRKIFAEEKPALVFHAAAIKHVPLSEENPLAAIHTNIIGTANVADSAVEENVKGVVLISTDKAVNPTNIMGATKRFAETYCQALGQDAASKNTKFSVVRFGNVLGSAGSVVPLFQRQIASGGPVTVTHPDMTRYFMTIREAVELVLMASSLGMEKNKDENGIFVLDMGTPMKIKDLAEQMIKLMGKKPNVEIKIEYSGIRPGEKLYEELFYPEEAPEPTECASVTLGVTRNLSYEKIRNNLTDFISEINSHDSTKALASLKTAVPEYKD